MLLKIVAFTGNVHGDFLAVAQSHTRDLAQSRVRLLRRHGSDLQANALLLRALVEHRRLAKRTRLTTWLANKLIDCRHQALRRIEDREGLASARKTTVTTLSRIAGSWIGKYPDRARGVKAS